MRAAVAWAGTTALPRALRRSTREEGPSATRRRSDLGAFSSPPGCREPQPRPLGFPCPGPCSSRPLRTSIDPTSQSASKAGARPGSRPRRPAHSCPSLGPGGHVAGHSPPARPVGLGAVPACCCPSSRSLRGCSSPSPASAGCPPTVGVLPSRTSLGGSSRLQPVTEDSRGTPGGDPPSAS